MRRERVSEAGVVGRALAVRSPQARERSGESNRAAAKKEEGRAEASEDVHLLIEEAARLMAARQWRFLGARNEGEAKTAFVSSCRRRIGCFVVREYARHRLRRVPLVGLLHADYAAPPRSLAQPLREDTLVHFYAHQAYDVFVRE